MLDAETFYDSDPSTGYRKHLHLIRPNYLTQLKYEETFWG